MYKYYVRNCIQLGNKLDLIIKTKDTFPYGISEPNDTYYISDHIVGFIRVTQFVLTLTGMQKIYVTS